MLEDILEGKTTIRFAFVLYNFLLSHFKTGMVGTVMGMGMGMKESGNGLHCMHTFCHGWSVIVFLGEEKICLFFGCDFCCGSEGCGGAALGFGNLCTKKNHLFSEGCATSNRWKK